MKNKNLKSIIEKNIKNFLSRLEIEITDSLKGYLSEICWQKIKKIVFSVGLIKKKNLKNIVCSDHLIPLLNKLNLGRYISEAKEEKIRKKSEEINLIKKNFKF
mmetsp:Transcript_40421/g.80973  ORF Transcript_40421/g.80973 Transcript_40421/m.80973 type:complete len:103 (-) Transcript_40421:2605-2913(-)